jgi:DNA-binding CsgD family transcriptional regulator
MTTLAGAVTQEHRQTLDFADLISGRMLAPAGYIGTTPTALIGRDHDLTRLAAVLADPDARLITVTGPAGVGKSRLVMEYFRRHAPATGGTVEAFDFGQGPDTAACGQLLRRLREHCVGGSRAVRAILERVGAGRHTLLLDHHEDVADDLVPLLAEFRRCCPQVRIVSIGTSRLGLYGEQVVRLRPLPTGTSAETEPSAIARIPAVELFVRCARVVRPEFALNAENAGAVLELCRLAGGLPFAIELAASEVGLAEPELILERSEQGFCDLRRIGHHPYSRHAGIQDMVSWVFAHLDDDERMLLKRLAIFEAPFTMRSVVGVMGRGGGGVHRIMERLVDKSALIPYQPHDGELSLTIPSVVRIASARSLAALPGHGALRKAHAEYFRAVAADRMRREPSLAGTAGRGGPGSDVLADLLAAFAYWRQAGDGSAMATIANALRERCAGAERARQCLRLAKEALRTGIDDPRLHAYTLETAGAMAVRLRSAAARRLLGQARKAHEAMDDKDGEIRCLRLLGDEAYGAGDLDRARLRLEEGLAILVAAGRGAGADGREAGSGERTATACLLKRRLAMVLREAGDLARAGELARAALVSELGRGDAGPAAITRYVLATIGWLEDDSAEARALFADAAEQVAGLPDIPEQPECLEMLAIALWKWGRITDWRRLTAALGMADRLRRRLGLTRPRPLSNMITPILAAASQELTAEQYSRASRTGADLTWTAALRLVPRGGAPAAPAAVASPEPGPDAGRGVPTDVADLLTKRELEVALLVAEGLTNRVIARRLGIAEWTVVNHLRRVMRKLGCQSRVHVTRRLARR